MKAEPPKKAEASETPESKRPAVQDTRREDERPTQSFVVSPEVETKTEPEPIRTPEREQRKQEEPVRPAAPVVERVAGPEVVEPKRARVEPGPRRPAARGTRLEDERPARSFLFSREAEKRPEPEAEPVRPSKREQRKQEEPERTEEPKAEEAPTTRGASFRPNIRFADSVEEVLARRREEAAAKASESQAATSQAPAPAEPEVPSKPEPKPEPRGRYGMAIDATGEIFRELDEESSGTFKVNTSPTTYGARRAATEVSSVAEREEQAEDASQDSIFTLPKLDVSLHGEEPESRLDDLADEGKAAEKLEVESESETEDTESRQDRKRRESRHSRRANSHVTLGSFLGRIGRAKETSAPEEERPAASRRGQIVVQESSSQYGREETSAASRVTVEPTPSAASSLLEDRVEPVSASFESRFEAKPTVEAEPKRERAVRDLGSVPFPEPIDAQKDASGSREDEPKAEPATSPVSEAELDAEMTTIINKTTRQASEAPKRPSSVVVTQVPSPADEAPEPSYEFESRFEPEPELEPVPEPEPQPQPQPEPDRRETGRQPSKDQPEARSGRHGSVVESFTGALARINLGKKTSESKTDDRAASAGTAATNRQKTPRQQRMLILAIATVIVAAAVAGVVFLISSAGAGRNTATATLRQMVTSMVYRGDFVDAITADGTVVPLVVMDVNGDVDGIVENLVIGQGSYVTAGDTLFKIRNDALEMAVTEASARLSEAERAVNDTDLAYRQAQADYQNAWNIAAMSNSWTTFDQTGLTNAINAAAANRSEAVAARDAASTALATAQASLGRCNVNAPISGIVTECNVANGVTVGAGGASGPLLKVGDVSQMKVTVLVGENYMPFIHQGQVATVTFPGLPDVTTTASVTAISSTPSGVAADATGMPSYAVEFMLAASDPNLRPGMTATLNVVLQSAGDSLIVPSKAIWQEVGEDGSTHYFVNVVTESGELLKSEVSIIAQNTEEAAVWGDIAEGDIVRVNN